MPFLPIKRNNAWPVLYSLSADVIPIPFVPVHPTSAMPYPFSPKYTETYPQPNVQVVTVLLRILSSISPMYPPPPPHPQQPLSRQLHQAVPEPAPSTAAAENQEDAAGAAMLNTDILSTSVQ